MMVIISPRRPVNTVKKLISPRYPMIKIFLKHWTYEKCIEVIFDGIFKNFILPKKPIYNIFNELSKEYDILLKYNLDICNNIMEHSDVLSQAWVEKNIITRIDELREKRRAALVNKQNAGYSPYITQGTYD